MINIAVATVSVPTKGLSLPLVSAGGSGLVISCAALGLLYSVLRFEHDDIAPSTLPPSNPAPRKRPPHRSPHVVTESQWRNWTVPT
jgi:hypothetical protein